MIAFGATVQIAGPGKTRSVPVEKFFRVSGSKGKRETVLATNELVTSVTVPVDSDCQSAEYEVREHQSHNWPLVQAAACVKVRSGKVDQARIVLGHGGPNPLRSPAAEKVIAGKALTAE